MNHLNDDYLTHAIQRLLIRFGLDIGIADFSVDYKNGFAVHESDNIRISVSCNYGSIAIVCMEKKKRGWVKTFSNNYEL